MKKNLCFLFAIAMMVSTLSFAQQNQPDYFNQVERYRKMKNAGAALTVIGGALIFTVPIIVYGNGDLQTSTVVTIFGIAGLGSGIPLYAVGKHNERKYKEKLQGLSVKFNANSRVYRPNILLSVLNKVSNTVSAVDTWILRSLVDNPEARLTRFQFFHVIARYLSLPQV